MALAFSKNYISELSEENPEKRFVEAAPILDRESKIEYVVPEENASGVIFDSEEAFLDALESFSRGEIAVFTSSGINGAAHEEFYQKSKAQALQKLREQGYFKKNMDQEGIHSNCFDTMVEGLVVDDHHILKLQYGTTDAIEADLAKKKNCIQSLQNASLQVEFEPVNRWWLKFDLKLMLEPFGIEDSVIEDIVAKMCDKRTMARRYPLTIQVNGQPVILLISIFANRLARRNADKWVRAEGTSAVYCAWEKVGADIVGDVPKLQFRFSLRERDKSLGPLENYKISHICKQEELDLVYQARQILADQIESIKESQPKF